MKYKVANPVNETFSYFATFKEAEKQAKVYLKMYKDVEEVEISWTEVKKVKR